MARSNAVMTYGYDAETRVMGWKFPSGIPPVEFTLPDHGLSERDDAALHNGFKQKIGDAAALGMTATPTAKREAMQSTVDTLNAGLWNAGRGEGDVVSYLSRAIAETRGKDVRAVAKWLRGKEAAERAGLALQEPYAAKIAEYRRAKVANVDTSVSEAEIDAL